MLGMMKKANLFGFTSVLHLAFFFIAFKAHIFNPNDFMFTIDFDGIKNYYNFLYYTAIQSEYGFDYYGMGYPIKENILFADSTPLLALLVKYLGLKFQAIGIYNLFFLISFLVTPLVAFGIARKFEFTALWTVLFSLFITWVHPMFLRLGEWSNLSLSIIYLLAFYILIHYIRGSRLKASWHLMVFLLILISSFLHLYYLIILGLGLGLAFLWGFVRMRDRKFFFGILSIALAAISVTIIYYLGDPSLAERSSPTLIEFRAPGKSASISDYFNPYPYIFLLASFSGGWLELVPQYLGSYFPLALGLVILSVVLKKSVFQNFEDEMKNRLLLGTILFTSIICFFTSLGFKIDFGGGIRIYNFLNPLNYLSELIDTVAHFRFLSRFGHFAFTGLTICIFYFLDRCFKTKSKAVLKYGAILAGALIVSDLISTIAYAPNRFNYPNIFSHEQLTKRYPDLSSYDFDAILPIPYYHIGCEVWGYSVDDDNVWSRDTYRMAIKYKKPLMSLKASRASLDITKKRLSLFSDSPDPELLDLLRGKSILLTVQNPMQFPTAKESPALEVTESFSDIYKNWNAEFIMNFKDADYYILEF